MIATFIVYGMHFGWFVRASQHTVYLASIVSDILLLNLFSTFLTYSSGKALWSTSTVRMVALPCDSLDARALTHENWCLFERKQRTVNGKR